MPRTLPPLNALRAFEAAGRHESFTGAAEELNVTHAAISRHVRGLEQRVGVQLFRTVPRGVQLTEKGREYLKAVTPALNRIARATEALSEDHEDTIAVSCEPSFAMKWLMPRLGLFNDAHPNLEVKLDATPKLADVQRYECDLAVRFCREAFDCLTTDLISASPLYPVASPRLFPSLDGSLSPEEILEHRLLHEDRGVLWQRWFETAGMPDVGVKKQSAPLQNLLAIEGALSGQGIVLLSNELAADDIRDGRLVRLSDIGVEYGCYYMLYLKETMRRKPVRQFRDWLLEETKPLR